MIHSFKLLFAQSQISSVVKIKRNTSMLEHNCTALLKAELFIEPPPDTQRIRRRGERGTGVARSSYLFLTSLSPLLPPPTSRVCCTAWGCLIRISWEEATPPSHSPPPPTTHAPPHDQKLVIFRDCDWKGGRPLFRDLKVMQLNSDSFCEWKW